MVTYKYECKYTTVEELNKVKIENDVQRYVNLVLGNVKCLWNEFHMIHDSGVDNLKDCGDKMRRIIHISNLTHELTKRLRPLVSYYSHYDTNTIENVNAVLDEIDQIHHNLEKSYNEFKSTSINSESVIKNNESNEPIQDSSSTIVYTIVGILWITFLIGMHLLIVSQ